MRLTHEGTDLGPLVRGVADDETHGRGHEALDDPVVDRTLDEDPAPRAAVLAGVVEHAHRALLDEAVDVGVGEADVRALAAELERDALHRAGGESHDLLARCRSRRSARPCRCPDATAIAGPTSPPGPVTTLTTPGGRPASSASSREAERRQGRERRRLQHARVAAGERRTELPRGDEQREVPRHDEPDDADRLAKRQVEAGLRDRDRLAGQALRARRRSSRTPARPRRSPSARPPIGLPTLRHSSQASSSAWSATTAASSRASGLARLPRAATRALERRLRSRDRTVDIGRIAHRDGRDRHAMGRVDDLARPPIQPRRPARRR